MREVGRNTPRREGADKVSGAAVYIDDHALPGCLHGVTLRSSIAHGRIQKIHFDPAFPWTECVVATAKDIPGRNVVHLIEDDQPLLADGIVRHQTEPILLVAHASREKAWQALAHIRVDYEPLIPVLTMEDSVAARTLLRGTDNVQKRLLVEKGDFEAALAKAEVVVEGEYRVPHQEQAYIENNGVAAFLEPDGTLVVMGSLQCPFYVQKAMVPIFDLPVEKVRIVQTVTGGGFGGKEEYPDMIAGHAALLAWKARRPVKMIYDRHEDMAATTKRHPARVRHRTGVTRDGRLVAQDIEVVMDGGAYVTLSPVVLSRGTLHATGPYECPNVRIRAACVATNTPPNGAFRGFGAPQTLFAAELHMEKIAEALGMDALALRRKNLFREGSVMATGQVLRESVGVGRALDTVARRSGYARKRLAHARWNRSPRRPTWRGIGIAAVHHGSGFTGSGEVTLASRAAVSLTRSGELRVLAASTEMGQGTNTLFTQIASDALGVPRDWITVQMPDTDRVPDSGPTVASRTCMVVGELVRRAAIDLRERTAGASGKLPKTRPALLAWAAQVCRSQPVITCTAEYEKPPGLQWDDATYRGDAYGVYSYAALAVDLEVDRATYEVTVRKVTTAQDVGKAIHPLMVEGQILGGTMQGLGYALLENAVYENGVMQNAELTNYIIPTALDTPEMDVTIIESPYSHGPFGAKGIGELPMDVPAPAVAAAIHDALGVWMQKLPILPEHLMRAHAARAARGAA